MSGIGDFSRFCRNEFFLGRYFGMDLLPVLTTTQPILTSYGLNPPSIVSWLLVNVPTYPIGPSDHFLILHFKKTFCGPFCRPFWVGLRLWTPLLYILG